MGLSLLKIDILDFAAEAAERDVFSVISGAEEDSSLFDDLPFWNDLVIRYEDESGFGGDFAVDFDF